MTSAHIHSTDMKPILIYIKNEGVDKSSENCEYEVIILSIERLALFVSNLYKHQNEIQIRIYLEKDEKLTPINDKQKHNYKNFLLKIFNKAIGADKLVELMIINSIDLSEFDDIYLPTKPLRLNTEGLTSDLELAEKKYNKRIQSISDQKNNQYRTYRLFMVIPNKISLHLIKANSKDFYFLDLLEQIQYYGSRVVSLPFSGENLSETQIEKLLPKTRLSLNYSIDGLENTTSIAKKGIFNWPIVEKGTSAYFMGMNFYYSGIGRITVNDYGPNATKYGFRSAIPRKNEYKLENEKRILLLGGSFVYGHGLPPHGTIGSNLEKILNKKQSINKYRVIDLGGCRENLIDQIIKLHQFYTLIKPDIIIPIAGLNQMESILNNDNDYDVYNAIEEAYPFNEFQYRKPFVNHLIQDIYENLRSKFNSISGFAKSEGVQSIMYLQPYPSFLRFEPSSYYVPNVKNMQQIYDSVALRFSQDKSGVKLVLQDLACYLINKYIYHSIFIDTCHVTSLGAKYMAQRIADDIP